MAYGSAAGVISLAPRYASNGAFNTTTRPTAAHVTAWLSQVNSLIDTALAEFGFSVPITDADITPMLDFFVNEEVAALVEGANGSGRFGPTDKKSSGRGRIAIMNEAREWVKANAAGLERMGAARSYSSLSGLGFRDTDERGNETHPLIQRDAFSADWINWDSSST
jgi:hypothetical protein